MHKARPFIKWVGGKTQLLEQFDNYYPSALSKGLIRHYVEPFLGGGALSSLNFHSVTKSLMPTYQT
jgi:DNA adenine methylase